MKRFFALILCTALLAGCAGTSLPTDSAGENVQQIQYDWMAGESPIPEYITGIDRQGEDHIQNGFECTDTGFYAMCGNWLLYCDHDSDEIIKLCGRPDCTHSDNSCNAYFEQGTNVCWEGGYLYVVVNNSQLVRLDPDGSNRVKMLEATNFSPAGHSTLESPHIWNGFFTIGMGYLDEDGTYMIDEYYAPLDTDGSSMERTSQFLPRQNDGDAYIVTTNEEMDTLFWVWDPETDEREFLTSTHLWEHPGYYGAEEAWYIEDGIIYNLNYESGTPEPVLDTGLEGYHYLHCFPDLFVISDSLDFWEEEPTTGVQNLYFYNWDFQLIGQIAVPWLWRIPICGVTPERILLSSPDYAYIPKYYINKAELDTGNITLHKFVWSEDFEDIYDKSKVDFFNPNGADIDVEFDAGDEYNN